MSFKLWNILRPLELISRRTNKFYSFKSDLSLEVIYPHSTKVNSFTQPESKDGKFTGYIPIEDLTISYCKASGPGGQNVNKRATKVDLRFHVRSAKWLSEDTKLKILDKCVTRINKDGFLVIRSDKTREALTNTLDAMTTLRQLIYKLEEPPPQISEETAEKLRKRKEKAVRMRLIEKRKASLIKRSRSYGFM